MRKVTISRMRERYAQTVLIFRITYVHLTYIACLCYVTLTLSFETFWLKSAVFLDCRHLLIRPVSFYSWKLESWQ